MMTTMTSKTIEKEEIQITVTIMETQIIGRLIISVINFLEFTRNFLMFDV